MPNIKSVKKDVLRSRERHLRNQSVKSKIKTFVKKTNTAISGGDADAVKQILSQTVSVVDKAAKRGIIHKNAANRRKARLNKAAAKASASSS